MKITTKKMKSGDVLLSPPPAGAAGLIGKAIVALTGGEVSHAALYCGKIKGVPTVAQSYIRGVEYITLEKLIVDDQTPFCYVRRHVREVDTKAIRRAARRYVDENNAYPFGNLGLLGILLLSKRVSENILKSKTFYNFLMMTCLKMIKGMNQLRDIVGRGEHPMSCAQFVAQCYDDARGDATIQFDKLLFDYENPESLTGSMSLLEFLTLTGENNPGDDGFLSPISEIDPQQEESITMAFVDLFQNKASEALFAEQANEKELRSGGNKLTLLMCEALTGQQPATIREAVQLLQQNRNYFVTPDDLLSHANNLTTVGKITG